MDGATTAAILSAVAALGAAFLTYRASSQANRINSTKVDAEAYDRAQVLWEKALAQAESQTDRLRSQVDRLSDQLATEQDVSNNLRNQVRTLQQTVTSMEQSLSALRLQIAGASTRPGS